MPTVALESTDNFSASPEQKIFYIEKGDKKEVIFFIHGWQQNRRDAFGPFIDYFSHLYKVVAIDLPGHGESYKKKGLEYSHEVAYQACLQVLNIISKEASHITIIGHSMGAFLTLKLAMLAKNKKIQNLVLISPVIDFIPYEAELKRFVKMKTWQIEAIMFLRALMNKYPYGDRKYIYDTEHGQKIPNRLKHYRFKQRNHPIHAAVGYMRSFIGCSLAPLVKNNHLPTLLIYGESDKLTPAEFGNSIASIMPRAVLRVVPKAGHSVQLARKDELISMIEEFILEHQKRSFAWRNIFSRKK